MRRNWRTSWALLAVVVGACSDGGLPTVQPTTLPPQTVEQTAPPITDPPDGAEFCATLQTVAAGGFGSGAFDWSDAPLGGLFVGGARPSDLSAAFADIAESAPASIEATLAALADAMDSPTAMAVGDSVAALAQAVGAGTLDVADLRSVDETAISSCGMEVVGEATLSATFLISPRLVNGGVEFGAGFSGAPGGLGSGIYGLDRQCGDDLVTNGYLIRRCDQRVIVLDLATGEPWWLDLNEAKDITDIKAGGGVLTLVTSEYVPQAGLEPARTELRAMAIDVATKDELWSMLLAPVDPSQLPAGYEEEWYVEMYYDIEVVGITSDGVVALDSPIYYACGQRIPGFAQAVGRDGSVLWTTEHIHGAYGAYFLAATGNDRGDCGDEVPYQEQLVLGADQSLVTSGYFYTMGESCTAWAQVSKNVYTGDPPTRFTNLRTGQTLEAPSETSSAEHYMRDGVLVRLDSGMYGFLTPSGVTWTIDPSVLSNSRAVNGELIVTDGLGAHIVIDQATGDEMERLSELPGQLVDEGRWQWVDVESGSRIEPSDPRWHCTTFDDLGESAAPQPVSGSLTGDDVTSRLSRAGIPMELFDSSPQTCEGVVLRDGTEMVYLPTGDTTLTVELWPTAEIATRQFSALKQMYTASATAPQRCVDDTGEEGWTYQPPATVTDIDATTFEYTGAAHSPTIGDFTFTYTVLLCHNAVVLVEPARVSDVQTALSC